MRNKTVVVTGGAGFIGSNIAKELSNNNKVIILDDLSTGNIKNIEDINNNNIKFIKGTITDLKLLKKIFKDVNYVFHEAAIPSVPRSIKDPIRSNYVNVNGTLNILTAARINKCVKKVIYASSSSIYGDTPTLPKKEDRPTYPLSPYALSKFTAEYYCQLFTKIYELETISLRYFNVYGPRQDPNSEYAAVIPKFITSILNNKSPIIYGDGEQTRDFTFIEDIVNANILAAESDNTGIFNIAGGKRISINKLAHTIMKICKTKLNLTYKEPRYGDIKHSLADITKAKEKLNFIPNFGLEKGLKETIKWFNKQK
jgi:UDP-glucose 4-epimerase